MNTNKVPSATSPLTSEIQTHERSLSPLLQNLAIDHQPVELLGRFLLRADESMMDRGVTLSLVPFLEFLEAYRILATNWPLLPQFRPDITGADPEDFIHLLGRNAQGEPVATAGARFLNWETTTLLEEATSLRLFYGPSAAPRGARCTITAPAARTLSGRVVFGGAAFYRSDYRGRMISALLPRILRCVSYARWRQDFTHSFVERILVQKGLPERYGYHHVQDSVQFEGILDSPFEGALVWMPRNDFLVDIAAFLCGLDAEVDGVAHHRGRKNVAA